MGLKLRLHQLQNVFGGDERAGGRWKASSQLPQVRGVGGELGRGEPLPGEQLLAGQEAWTGSSMDQDMDQDRQEVPAAEFLSNLTWSAECSLSFAFSAGLPTN